MDLKQGGNVEGREFFKEFLCIGSLLWDKNGVKWDLYHYFNNEELFKGKVVSMEYGWMLQYFFSIYRDLVFGDLKHVWFFFLLWPSGGKD